MSVSIFDDDDRSYFEWLQAHPDGYVLNTGRSSGSSEIILHRAICATISQYTGRAVPGAFTERTYIKICATGTAALEEWARRNRPRGRLNTGCPFCNP